MASSSSQNPAESNFSEGLVSLLTQGFMWAGQCAMPEIYVELSEFAVESFRFVVAGSCIGPPPPNDNMIRDVEILSQYKFLTMEDIGKKFPAGLYGKRTEGKAEEKVRQKQHQ